MDNEAAAPAARRAYSYKRFSSPKQSRGDSIRRQTEFEQRIVKEMDLLLDDTLDLSDTGVSAFHGRNARFGALAEFMKLVEAGRIPEGSVLIVENIDRLSRENVFDAFNLFSRIIGAGITLVTAEPFDTYDKAGVQGNVAKLMVPLVYMMRAHDESKTKSHRIHQAWESRRRRAAADGTPLTERCPHWLRVERADGRKRYAVVEERARVVRDIYRWVREGLGVGRIAAHLVAGGVPPFGKKDRWHKTYVRKLLTWPAVCGEMQPYLFKEGKKVKAGDPVPDYFPAVVSREEFVTTRETMRDRRGRDGRPAAGEGNLFTGLVWHAGDRVRMSVKTSNGPKKRTPYLRSNLCDQGHPAGGRQFPYEKFEKALLHALAELRPEDVSDRFREPKADLDGRIERLSGELFVLDGRCKEVEAQLLDPGNGVAAKALVSMLNRAYDARDGAQRQLNSLLAEAAACRAGDAGVAKTVASLLSDTPPGPGRERLRRQIKARLRRLVDSIWVHIEKVNHVRQFAHVQVFLRNGTRRDLLVEAFAGEGGHASAPAPRYCDVDFRAHVPAER